MTSMIRSLVAIFALTIFHSGQVIACSPGDTSVDDETTAQTIQKSPYQKAVDKHGTATVWAAIAVVYAKHGIKVTKDAITDTKYNAKDAINNVKSHEKIQQFKEALAKLKKEASLWAPGSQEDVENLEGELAQ